MSRSTPIHRECVITLIQEGMSIGAIVWRFGCHHTRPTILRLDDHFQVTRFTSDQERSGRHTWQRLDKTDASSAESHAASSPYCCYCEGFISVYTVHHRTALLVCRGRMSTQYYCGNMPRHHVRSLFRHQDLYTFQHENAQVHTWKHCVSARMAFPLSFLLPIEHLFDDIERPLSRSSTSKSLEEALLRDWRMIPWVAIFRSLSPPYGNFAWRVYC